MLFLAFLAFIDPSLQVFDLRIEHLRLLRRKRQQEREADASHGCNHSGDGEEVGWGDGEPH